MLRWVGLILGVVVALGYSIPALPPGSNGAMWGALVALCGLGQMISPRHFPLTAAPFLVVASAGSRGIFWLPVVTGLIIRSVRKHPLTDSLPEIWAAAAAAVGAAYLEPTWTPWLAALTLLLSWRLNCMQESTAAPVALLCIVGAAATSLAPVPCLLLALGSLLIVIPAQVQIASAQAHELSRADSDHAKIRQRELAALEQRSTQLASLEQHTQIQARCLKSVADFLSETSRSSHPGPLRSSLVYSLQRLIPSDWLGIYRADGALIASQGKAELAPSEMPAVLDRARPQFTESQNFYQMLAQDREVVVLRRVQPFEEAHLELLSMWLPNLSMCLDAICFQENQSRALGGEQVRRQELARMAERLTATLNLLGRLVGLRSLDELVQTAQNALPELIPQYTVEVRWRERQFKPTGGLEVARTAQDHKWTLTAQGRETGFLRLRSTLGQALNEVDLELLRLFSSQFSCLLETAELQEDLRQTLDQLRLSQAQVVQSSKMAAVGQLAAGVAHELNTPLGAITVGCELVRKQIPQDPGKAQERLANIIEAASKMQDVIAKLLQYSGDSSSQGRPLEVLNIVKDTLVMMPTPGVEVKVAPTQARKAWANPTDVQQVVRALLSNALECGAKSIEIWQEEAESKVALHIRDNGPGMPESVSSRIYEPFYTTKQVGQGSGLGLSTALQLMKQNKGELSHQTQPGSGTTFTLRLPAAPP